MIVNMDELFDLAMLHREAGAFELGADRLLAALSQLYESCAKDQDHLMTIILTPTQPMCAPEWDKVCNYVIQNPTLCMLHPIAPLAARGCNI